MAFAVNSSVLPQRIMLISVWLACVPCVLAQVTIPSSVIDGGGTFSTNMTFQHFGAIGQACPVGLTENTANINYSGFLNSFLLAPEQDTDGDGVANENDPDDDNDYLGDSTEILGSAFLPQTGTDPFLSDTDGDGAIDGAESVAGTNPMDPASLLIILFASMDGTNAVVQWQSRGGKTYDVLQGASVESLFAAPSIVDVVAASGGVGPWRETTSVSTNAASGGDAYFGVRVLP